MGQYSPRTKMVEVVINGQYVGVYVFMERIKQNPGRVNIDPLEYGDIGENEITGGYIVKIDKTTGGGIVAWTSPFPQAAPATGSIEYQLHDPDFDTINPAQLSYIQTFVTDFETALNGASYTDPVLGYRPYIDINSFIDFMIVNEISKNVDGYRISTFFHKQRDSDGGKFVAGPLWDFNLGWGNANYCQGGLTTGWEIYYNNVCGGGGGLNNPNYWNIMVTDVDFAHDLNCRWQELRMTTLHTDTLLAYIDQMETYLDDAAIRNYDRWPILSTYVWPNNFIGSTYAEEMDYLKSWTTARLAWMDANMFGSCPDLSADNYSLPSVNIYPNPTNSELTIQMSQPLENGHFIIYDILGNQVSSGTLEDRLLTKTDISSLAKGAYALHIYDGKEVVGREKLIHN
ncbi:CotH kinase family protein [Crocinitomix catalasitica]|nr:CotH kinase family protein [Crocinitomix catalasitica]